MLWSEVLYNCCIEIDAKSPLMSWKVKNNIKFSAFLYVTNGKHSILPEMVAYNFHWFLQQDVYALEMRNHKLFVLNSFAL